MNLNNQLMSILPDQGTMTDRINQTLNHTKIAIAGLLLAPCLALALPSDRQQPININSDTADIDNKKGISIYRGNVVMTQGTTRITGKVVTIYYSTRKISKVIATGGKERAYYEELQSEQQGMIQAWGKTIEYDLTKDKIELVENAQLAQKGDTFKGDKIDYDISEQTVVAKSAPNQSGSGRVHMVIQPKNNQTKP